jgi:hypothetical protein
MASETAADSAERPDGYHWLTRDLSQWSVETEPQHDSSEKAGRKHDADGRQGSMMAQRAIQTAVAR